MLNDVDKQLEHDHLQHVYQYEIVIYFPELPQIGQCLDETFNTCGGIFRSLFSLKPSTIDDVFLENALETQCR